MNTYKMRLTRLALASALAFGLASVGCVAGEDGATGPIGEQGLTGAQGPEGAAGPTGPQGAAGLAGTQGPAGSAGNDGAAGPQGDAGLDGLVDFEDIDPGDTCAFGGVRVHSGMDANGDGVLDEDERDASQTICHPADTSCGHALEITGLTGLDQTFYQGATSEVLTLETNASTPLTLSFMGLGLGFDTTDNVGEFTITPTRVAQSVSFALVASDGCTIATRSFTLPAVLPSEITIHVLNLSLGDLVVRSQDEVVASARAAAISSQYLELPFGAVEFELESTVLGQPTPALTTANLDPTPSGSYTLIVYDEGDSLAARFMTNDVSDPGDEVRVRFSHAASSVGTLDLLVDDALIFQDLSFGDDADYILVPENTDVTTIGLDVDQDGISDSLFRLFDEGFVAGWVLHFYIYERAGSPAIMAHLVNTTGPAALNLVIQSGARLPESFDLPGFPQGWFGAGDVPWTSVPDELGSGSFMMANGVLPPGSNISAIGAAFVFDTPGVLSFAWKLNGVPGDYLVLCVNPEPCGPSQTTAQLQIVQDWSIGELQITQPGSYEIFWVYFSGDFSHPSPVAFLDDISFMPTP